MTTADTLTVWTLRRRIDGTYELWQEGEPLDQVDWPSEFANSLGFIEAQNALLAAQVDAMIANASGRTTTLTAQANAGQATLTVASSTGFLVGDLIYIGTGATFESRIVATVPGSGTSITVTVNLTNTYAIGKPVSRSPVEVVDARGGFTTLGGRITLIESRVFDVRKYGALGNGTTNDLPAFQAAVTALNVFGGGTVYVPPGNYKLGNSWSIDADVIHVELAPGAIVFTDGATSDGHTIGFIGGGVGLGGATTPQKTWASIHGGRVHNLNNGTLDNAIGFARYVNARCEGVRVTLCGRKAITAQSGVDNVYFNGNVINATGQEGITVETSCDNVHIEDNLIELSALVGINVTGAITDARVAGNVILDTTTGNGISLSGVTRGWIERNTVRLAGGSGIISPSGTELVVRGNEVYQPQQHGINITGTTGRCEVSDNYISAAGQAAANTYDAIVFTSVAIRPIIHGNRTDGALHRYNVNAISMSGLAPLIPPSNVLASTMLTAPFGGWTPAPDEWTGTIPPYAVNSASVDTGAANRAVMVPFVPRTDKLVTKVNFRVGTTGGNLDAGVYDAALARLSSTGSVAVPAAGNAVINLTVPVYLRAGVLYYIGIALSGTTGKLCGFSGVSAITTGQSFIRRMETALPLPATFVVGGDDDIALIPGVWLAP